MKIEKVIIRATLAFVAVVSCSTAYATIQRRDLIIYGGKEYELASIEKTAAPYPSETSYREALEQMTAKEKEAHLEANFPMWEYFQKHPVKKRSYRERLSAPTNLRRGHIATYEVKDGQLFLKDIEIPFTERDGENLKLKYRSAMKEIFPDGKPLKIDWVSGTFYLHKRLPDDEATRLQLLQEGIPTSAALVIEKGDVRKVGSPSMFGSSDFRPISGVYPPHVRKLNHISVVDAYIALHDLFFDIRGWRSPPIVGDADRQTITIHGSTREQKLACEILDQLDRKQEPYMRALFAITSDDARTALETTLATFKPDVKINVVTHEEYAPVIHIHGSREAKELARKCLDQLDPRPPQKATIFP